MATALTAFLAGDHREMDRLLARSRAGSEIDLETYDLFRERLLRHIGWEEKILAAFYEGPIPLPER